MPEASEALDLEHFRRILQDREKDLSAEIVQLDEEGREARVAEVEDPIDEVTSDEAKAGAFAVSTKAAEMLADVRAALTRIDHGEYGICIDCGRPIGKKRLEAVPWTPYCIEDQERHDRDDRAEPSVFDAAAG